MIDFPKYRNTLILFGINIVLPLLVSLLTNDWGSLRTTYPVTIGATLTTAGLVWRRPSKDKDARRGKSQSEMDPQSSNALLPFLAWGLGDWIFLADGLIFGLKVSCDRKSLLSFADQIRIFGLLVAVFPSEGDQWAVACISIALFTGILSIVDVLILFNLRIRYLLHYYLERFRLLPLARILIACGLFLVYMLLPTDYPWDLMLSVIAFLSLILTYPILYIERNRIRQLIGGEFRNNMNRFPNKSLKDAFDLFLKSEGLEVHEKEKKIILPEYE